MKKKIFLIIALLISITLISIWLVMRIFTKQREEKVSLKNDYIVIEYGETYNPSLENLINLAEFNYIKPQDITIESDLKNQEGKEYPSVGTYQIYVYYKKRILIQNVEIKDTITPELEIEEIKIEKGIDLSKFDFQNYVKLFDLSKMKEYVIDYSNVDTNVSGEYIAKISVEDIYGNSIEKEFKIIIPEIEEKKIEQSNVQEKQAVKKSSTNISKTPEIKGSTKNSQVNNNSLKNVEKSNSNKNNSNSNSEKKEKLCTEGGSKHLAGNGPNEHGYYKSSEEAYAKLKEYMKNFDSGNYKVDECPCGLYYFWVVQK